MNRSGDLSMESEVCIEMAPGVSRSHFQCA